MSRLDRLLDEVNAARPELLDAWEATALIESFGYTDSGVRAAFQFPTTLALGEYVFSQRRRSGARAAHNAAGRRVPLGHYLQAILSSLVYAVPWLVTFVAEAQRPDWLQLSPEVGAALSVALMASLVVSGGFVRVIARHTQFYLGIKQPTLARQTAFVLLSMGLASAIMAGSGAVLVGWYFSLFRGPLLLLAAAYFIVLTALWMQCAILGLASSLWRIPLVFVAAGAAFAIAKAMGAGTLVAEVIAACTAVGCASGLSPHVFRGAGADASVVDLPRPHAGVVANDLAPYFLYGVMYFTFVICDRMSASAAVLALGRGPFGIPQPYKDGMDLALLTFLLGAAAIECCNLAFMRAWRAGNMPFESGFERGILRLRRQRARVLVVLVTSFAIVACCVRIAAVPLLGRSLSGLAETILIVGDCGYLLLAVGLLNAVTLSSVNRVEAATRALSVGVAVNLLTGGLLSHLFTPYFATVGLTTGAAVFAGLTARELRTILLNADHVYAEV